MQSQGGPRDGVRDFSEQQDSLEGALAQRNRLVVENAAQAGRAASLQQQIRGQQEELVTARVEADFLASEYAALQQKCSELQRLLQQEKLARQALERVVAHTALRQAEFTDNSVASRQLQISRLKSDVEHERALSATQAAALEQQIREKDDLIERLLDQLALASSPMRGSDAFMQNALQTAILKSERHNGREEPGLQRGGIKAGIPLLEQYQALEAENEELKKALQDSRQRAQEVLEAREDFFSRALDEERRGFEQQVTREAGLIRAEKEQLQILMQAHHLQSRQAYAELEDELTRAKQQMVGKDERWMFHQELEKLRADKIRLEERLAVMVANSEGQRRAALSALQM